MNITENREALFKAISAAQGEFSTVEKGKDNSFFKSKYAPLDAIIEMIRPILPKYGLAVMQFTDMPENGDGIIVETIITHQSGQYVSGRLLMPLAKVDPQGAGSAITYGRRYALAAALNIVSDEDVDGNHNTDTKTPPKKDVQAPTPKSEPQAAKATGPDAEYQERVKTALKAIFGEDKNAALAKVEELTSFVPKGKTEAEKVKGIRDYTKLTGKRLEILAHSIEKLVPKEVASAICNECRKPLVNGACHNTSCPEAKPTKEPNDPFWQAPPDDDIPF